jgi:hypothetical protein
MYIKVHCVAVVTVVTVVLPWAVANTRCEHPETYGRAPTKSHSNKITHRSNITPSMDLNY